MKEFTPFEPIKLLSNPNSGFLGKSLKLNSQSHLIYIERLVSLKIIILDEKGTFKKDMRVEGKGSQIIDFKPFGGDRIATIRDDGFLGLIEYETEGKNFKNIAEMKIKKDFETSPKCIDVCFKGKFVVVLFEDLDRNASKIYLFEIFPSATGHLFLFKNIVDVKNFSGCLNEIKFLPYIEESCCITGIFSNKYDSIMTLFWNSRDSVLNKINLEGGFGISKGVEKLIIKDEDVYSVARDGSIFTLRYCYGETLDEDLGELNSDEVIGI